MGGRIHGGFMADSWRIHGDDDFVVFVLAETTNSRIHGGFMAGAEGEGKGGA